MEEREKETQRLREEIDSSDAKAQQAFLIFTDFSRSGLCCKLCRNLYRRFALVQLSRAVQPAMEQDEER